jgi:hypothetical protein
MIPRERERERERERILNHKEEAMEKGVGR